MKFKEGDRVSYSGAKCTVQKYCDDGILIQCLLDCGVVINVLPEDCRRLVKKKKPKREPRTIYIESFGRGYNYVVHTDEPIQFWPKGKVKFIEVIEP